MLLGVICPMEAEVKPVLELMTIEKKIEKFGIQIWEGSIGNTKLVVALSGIGKVAAAATTQALICEYGVTHIINAGIAGGLSKRLHVGALVVSTKTEYYDVRPNDILIENFPNMGVYEADSELVEIAAQAIRRLNLQEISHFGVMTTGDQFITDSKVKEETFAQSEALCVDMEGGAIAHVCFLNKVKFVIIRSISDMADDEAEGVYLEYKNNAHKIYSDVLGSLVKALV